MEKFVIGRVEIDTEEGWRPLTPPIALGLVQHPDGQKGHWAREGNVSLGHTILQAGLSLDGKSAVPIVPVTSPAVPETTPVLTLTPGQLEPEVNSVDRQRERQRSVAYQALRARIIEAGLFKKPGPLAGYGHDLVRYAILAAAALSLFLL
jgi:delta8-fatty-acid desaturase